MPERIERVDEVAAEREKQGEEPEREVVAQLDEQDLKEMRSRLDAVNAAERDIQILGRELSHVKEKAQLFVRFATSKYKLIEGDKFEPSTGAITRLKPVAPVVNPIADAAVDDEMLDNLPMD